MFPVVKTEETAITDQEASSVSQMEGKSCSQRWRTHLPEFKHSHRLCPAADNGQRTDGKHKEANNNVTIAATSRYLTYRRYVERKPLTSGEQHGSILKGTHPQNVTEKVKPHDSRTEHTSIRDLTEPREAAGSHSHISLSTASSKDHTSPLNVSGLQGRPGSEEPGFRLSFHGSKSVLQSPFSSILEVQKLNPPVRPQLTSTVLYPTYTPRSQNFKSSKAQLRFQEGTRREDTSLGIPKESSKRNDMSSFQEDYWTCAIPKTLPPSPNRQSAGWNPNKEYETLLDYTYPLRPGHVDCEWSSSELQGDSFLKTNPYMQDSGIELDHLDSSASLSGFEFSENGEEKTRDTQTFFAGYRSPDLEGFLKSSDSPSFSTPVSLTKPMGLFSDSLDRSRDKCENRYHNRSGHNHQHRAAASSTSTTFVCSTTVLPRSRNICGEVDEDFLLLPEQLEELQQLSRQVREVTAQLSRPVTASLESLDQATILSSVTLSRKQEAEHEDGNDLGRKQSEESNGAETESHERDSESIRSGFGAGVKRFGGGLSQSNVREVETLMKELCTPTLPEGQKNSQELQEKSDSLMQRTKVFCSHLELLIQQLYALAERMERLAAPTVDIESVKLSLAEYQSFQKEMSEHQPLTSCVLHAGQHLLSCINNTSPFLRDTLLLIERQSGALQTHSDHMFSSILFAMDSLTQNTSSSPAEWRRVDGPVGT
ncbi:centrosomal protein of 68 kDa [Nematolebias whitei]|uniref:centrosomal protein of 68 kDa n=1 Tax=Nematolebias whitei TaxID=451745 RepID=UPI001897CAF8|nr:centrosomal protein of 68 kDa [Nematolebias whitei]